jgi:hypothetical protein
MGGKLTLANNELAAGPAYRKRIANWLDIALECPICRQKETQICENLLQFMQSHSLARLS